MLVHNEKGRDDFKFLGDAIQSLASHVPIGRSSVRYRHVLPFAKHVKSVTVFGQKKRTERRLSVDQPQEVVMSPVASIVHLNLALLVSLLGTHRRTLMVAATVPAAPVNVSVTQLRANSATVTWDVPQRDTVIGYGILQQRQDGLMQRSIREVNTSSQACVLWDLDEDTHYSVQVQSIGVQGDSQPSRTVHFRTLERTDYYPVGVLDHDDPTMEGLDMTPHLQTGELLIVTTVLLLWAAVIALFCRQYDIIKDNDSNNSKEKPKRPSVRASSLSSNSVQSSPLYHKGELQKDKLHRTSSSISIIRV